MIPNRRLLLGAGLACALTGCATAALRVTATPEDIPALEQAIAARPGSADTLTLLGAAYQAAGRYDEAVDVLERALATGAAPPVASLYLGLSLEALQRWQDARAAYASYLASADDDSELRRDVEGRVALVERELLDLEARTMLEQEAALSQQEPEPRSVAVFPFRVTSQDPRFEPLQLALADMVTTDLAIPGVLVLLERARIQAIVREMALSLAGYAEPATGARVGRLMRAEHVVQGSVTLLPDERVRLEMAVLDAASRERTGAAQEEGALEAIFDAEKALVLRVLDVLGVTLTAAEREAIEENRSRSLLAFLAYGEGLMAMERNDFDAAAAAFGQAVELDPGFQPAVRRGQEAAGLGRAAASGTGGVANAAATELPRGALVRAPELQAALDNVVAHTNPNPGSDYTGEGGPDDIADAGLNDDDTRNDQNETHIGGQPVATVDIDIPNPTLP